MAGTIAPQPWMTDPAALAVLEALRAAGGEDAARFVGGCVRDALLGRAIVDIDIATPLTPPEVVGALEAAGLRAIPTGVEHGTITAIANRRPFEITTLRRDVATDGRRAVVAFTTDWAEDAARRDFRLNALYLDRHGRLFDPIGGGIDDAHAGRIVFVGDAETRIREDYLRILRFFRFRAWYGQGAPDAAAVAACARLKDGVAGLSGERVAKELLKLLAADDPRPSLRLMAETGVLAVALPQADPGPRFAAMVDLSNDPELRLAALLPDALDRLGVATQRLRLSNLQRDRLVAAAESAPAFGLAASDSDARRVLYRIGRQAFDDRVLKLLAAEQGPDAAARRLLDVAAGWTRPVFPIGGGDVMAAGASVGPEVGRQLAELEAWWMEHDFVPDRDALLQRLKAGR